ncbi:hypothetical protein [Chelativorans salis]|uniref:Co-chaperone DjlA N-terminal domain-containing protein n=1 Tax=Chelativorans salis TaxID=2978478 RepID=A0ABT2LMH1_9HYPH|nr:hypothetical protein [Chelativorans sp. EGI FJ00035]MCT7375269.1 hypothetical protein [Chelativorans sp. EGI FJ00035]
MAVDMPTKTVGPVGGRPPSPTELAGDVLLLLRLTLNDGEMTPSARDALQRVAERAFGIDASSFEAFLPALQPYGVKDTGKASIVFRARPKDERVFLARMLLAAALKGDTLTLHEERLRARSAEILGLDEGDVR